VDEGLEHRGVLCGGLVWHGARVGAGSEAAPGELDQSRGGEDGVVGQMPREAYRELERSMGERSLTGRIGRPEDVAEAFVYAMRDENATGTVVGTNGGGLLV